jgi:hypothetical protein
MILPVVLGAFFKVLRQRIRIWSFEKSQATHIKDSEIVQATSVCDTLTYRELKLENEADELHVPSECHSRCAICMNDFELTDSLTKLPCNHYFHKDPCLVGWFKLKL